MKDVISAAAGIAGFAIESARDLVQYMVRRGQMTPEEGERLIREAEAAHEKRSPGEKAKATATKIALSGGAQKPKRPRAQPLLTRRRTRGRSPRRPPPVAAQTSTPKSSAGSSVAHKTTTLSARQSTGQECGAETCAGGEGQGRKTGEGRQTRQGDQAREEAKE